MGVMELLDTQRTLFGVWGHPLNIPYLDSRDTAFNCLDSAEAQFRRTERETPLRPIKSIDAISTRCSKI